MRDFLVFLVLATIAFFVIGETIGVQLGFPSHTPVYVYKQDGVASAERRTVTRSELPIEVRGRVRNGAVTVRVVYQDPGSFQSRREARPEEIAYEESFSEGRMVALNRTFDEGAGVYRVELVFEGATGLFRVGLPRSSEL